MLIDWTLFLDDAINFDLAIGALFIEILFAYILMEYI